MTVRDDSVIRMVRRIICLKWLFRVFAMGICVWSCFSALGMIVNPSDSSRCSTTGDHFKRARQRHMIYILWWPTSSQYYWNEGQTIFKSHNCSYTNCFSTTNASLLPNIKAFDAVVFEGMIMNTINSTQLPMRRSPHQKYIFGSDESAHSYPLCDPVFDGFFNMTFTYKLNSDSRWGYMVIRDSKGGVIGPNEKMHWIKNMKPIGKELKEELRTKKTAAAWFVSHCYTNGRREIFVNELAMELRNFNLTLDVYGSCHRIPCPEDRCTRLLEPNYYFYLAFENSFSEDYVTEKLLRAISHNTVPVVYGGANYTRFMPDSMYLDARALGPSKLARTMYDIIHDDNRYYSFFNYKNHYSFSGKNDHIETNDYCGLCAMLNDKKRMGKKTVYRNFRKWWNNPEERCL